MKAPAILKLFAKQLLTLTKNCDKTAHAHLYKRHPNLQIWLKLLNTTPSTIDAMGELSFHDLFEKSDTELRDFLDKSATINASELEIQMISSSFQNLKTFCKLKNIWKWLVKRSDLLFGFNVILNNNKKLCCVLKIFKNWINSRVE